PYGYHITNTKKMTFEVDEKAAEIVRKIFELYNSGWGYKKIANYLTEEGIPTPRMLEKERREADGAETKIKASAVWAIPSISGILTNDFYIGTLRQKKYTRTKINGSDKKLDSDENIVFENNHEAIIDVRSFAKAQEQLKARSKSNYRGVKKYDTSYSGFLFCGDCGSPMFSMSRPDLSPAYTCGTYHKRGLKGCTSHHTRTDTLDIMIKKYIERVMMNSERMIAELEQAIRNEPEMMKKSKSSIELLEVDLAKAKEEFKATKKQKIRELMKSEDNQELIEETFAEIEEELQKKIEGLEKQIAFASEHRNMTIQVNRIAKTAIEIFREILAKDKLDKTDLSLIVDRITVFENNIEIQLKADIAMLLECGTVTKELLEESDFVGKAVNFKWDTESIAKATIVQKANHRTDKAFGVNVVCEGDPLEIFTAPDGEVIFKKYSPVGELSTLAAQYAEVLYRGANSPILICDRDRVIACAGISKKEVIDRQLSEELEDYMERRESFITQREGDGMTPAIGVDRKACVASPIIAAGDVSGAVVMLGDEKLSVPVPADIKLVQVAANFLGRQMEE
ncbi:MAG: recombinase family protein, partial [Clostridia bacterium]|nr:recombinase family protein [Clostridia bacterium]